MAAAAERGNETGRAVIRELNRLHGLAKEGELGKLAQSLDELAELGVKLDRTLTELRDKLPFDPAAYLASGAYLAELRAALEAADLPFVEEDGSLLCSPSVIRILPRQVAVEIDGQRDRRLNPRTLVETIAAHRRKEPRYQPERFLNSVRQSYDLIVTKNAGRTDAVTRLVDIWQVLTLLPGQDKEYTLQDFARDLYHLDASGTVTTLQSTRQLRWCGSTGIRSSGVLCVVGADGRPRKYWGVSFVEPHNGTHP
ncbi:hypothetical protein ALI144C_36475 [Actinosynnema sp. ALI-1.44]|nr:hypothetical protein ALI144C_36475 [Actinosynnema sp. ALI-1.44]